MRVVDLKAELGDDVKQVVYYGIIVTVANETVAIAADQDGEVWAYHNEQPKMFEDSFGIGVHTDAVCERIPYVVAEFEHLDEWKDSLVEYPLGEQS